MRFRQAFYRWLIPAAFVLPLWLLVGWGVFQAGGWAFALTVFIAMPSVFIGQLVFTLLVRARGTVRAHRAVSWWDVLAFGVWHVLTILVGCFLESWFALTLVGAILAGLAVLWSSLWQLWREAKPSAVLVRMEEDLRRTAPRPAADATPAVQPDVIVIEERRDLS